MAKSSPYRTAVNPKGPSEKENPFERIINNKTTGILGVKTMNMTMLTAAVSRLTEYQELIAAMEGGKCPVAVSGVAAVHRAHIAAGIHRTTQRPIIMVCADEGEAKRMAQDPRPSYQEDPERVYGMKFGGMEIKFRVSGSELTVCEVIR